MFTFCILYEIVASIEKSLPHYFWHSSKLWPTFVWRRCKSVHNHLKCVELHRAPVLVLNIMYGFLDLIFIKTPKTSFTAQSFLAVPMWLKYCFLGVASIKTNFTTCIQNDFHCCTGLDNSYSIWFMATLLKSIKSMLHLKGLFTYHVYGCLDGTKIKMHTHQFGLPIATVRSWLWETLLTAINE